MTIDEQIECVTREIKRRTHLYPGRVANARMSQKDATYEIASMRAVLTTLTQLRGIVAAAPTEQAA